MTLGLHQIVQSVQQYDYNAGLAVYTQMVSQGNFSEISSFMPGLKMLIQSAAHLQVYVQWLQSSLEWKNYFYDWAVRMCTVNVLSFLTSLLYDFFPHLFNNYFLEFWRNILDCVVNCFSRIANEILKKVGFFCEFVLEN